MRLLIERVKEAKCVIDNNVHSSIKNGYLVYVAYESKDNESIIDKALDKLIKLRLFTDENHKLNKSIIDVNGEILLISSFTLFADPKTGNRPSFSKSVPFSIGEPLFEYTKYSLNRRINSQFGVFGADMDILSINDGPVSIIMDI